MDEMKPQITLIHEGPEVRHYAVWAEVNGVLVQGIFAQFPESYDTETHKPVWPEMTEFRVVPIHDGQVTGASIVYKMFGHDVLLAAQVRVI